MPTPIAESVNVLIVWMPGRTKCLVHYVTHRIFQIHILSMKIFLLISVWLYGVTVVLAGDDFTVLPKAVSLCGPSASAGILTQKIVRTEGASSPVISDQITSGVHLEVVDSNVARVEGSKVYAVSDGTTELLVHVHGYPKVARIPISVRNADQDQHWEFAAHVQSVFSRHGCNSGACHGALAGKGGFRLSLLGYDSIADHDAITSQDQGRRIEPSDPGSSLLLSKPSMHVPHKGGLRLDADGADFHLLGQWIASGSLGPQDDDAALRGIEVLPDQFQASVEASQSLRVRAFYEDGRVEDVTHWARFSSTNEAVATVDAEGHVRIVGNGRGAIVAWFSSRISLATVDVPFGSLPSSVLQETGMDSATPTSATVAFGSESDPHGRPVKPQHLIDEILAREWQLLELGPSPLCDDLTFLRRATLNATGALPDSQRVIELLSSGQPLDREKLIDDLLESPEYIDYWSYIWSDLLLVNGNLLRPKAVEAFYKWIRSQVEANVPWDEFARTIVLARGDSLSNGATNFYAIHQTPEAMTENVCLAFMGLSIECAKCHNHPLERWTNDQYYAMANLFSRVRAKGWGGDPRGGEGDRTLIVLERGELIQPSRGRPQLPAPLDQAPLRPEDTKDRRESLAKWLVSTENRYFSRAISNRVWANFMGVGLVESVDDLRMSNPASSELLLNSLAHFLIEHHYDLKALMRLIMSSRAYQLSSVATDQNQADQRFYCRYYPRRLSAEVLHDAMVKVTNVPTHFDQIEFVGADKQPTDFYPRGTKALGLFDSAVSNYFLQTFGRHQRRITCECERSNEPTVVQALHLNNGDTLNAKLSHQDCIISQWLVDSMTVDGMIEQSYARALTRWPTEQERQKIQREFQVALENGVPVRELAEDLLWGLMSSPEFLFTH